MSDIGLTLEGITQAAQQYIVAPIAAFGVAGFVFNVQSESVAIMQADITDHYTEDNRALQDHIAIRPKRVTLKGYVGELVYSPGAGGAPAVLQNVAQKLTEVAAYLPSIAAGAETIEQGITSSPSLTLSNVSNIYATVQNVLGAFGNTQNQQNAFTFFRSLMQSATLMGVQTPWEFMANMAIETITAVQPEESQFITDFAITLKEIRIAQVTTTAYSPGGSGGIVPAGGPSLQGPADVQAQPPANIGNVPGVALPTNNPGAQGTITGPEGIKSTPSLFDLFSLPLSGRQ